jgi:hypothetical protein
VKCLFAVAEAVEQAVQQAVEEAVQERWGALRGVMKACRVLATRDLLTLLVQKYLPAYTDPALPWTNLSAF